MCGIAGAFQVSEDPGVLLNRVKTMTDLLQHRGPDFRDVDQFEDLTLGHSRLSIIDTSEAAHQPFKDVSRKKALVFNGEIYNYRVLKKDLENRGELFKSESDTEVLFHMLSNIGIEAVQRLNGMFAFAWWDQQENKLTLVRDRYGIKPLYYTFQQDGLYFASEIRALKPAVDFRLNQKQLNRLLTLQSVHGEETAIEGINELAPGTMLTFDADGNYEITNWFEPEPVFNQKKDPEITEEDVRTQFFKAVEKRLISDVPIGAFLSGGVDSSAVVAAMAQQSSSPVKTFTVGFDDERFDERLFAKKVADRYNTNHQEILLSEKEILGMVPDAITSMDTPSGDAVNTYIVSRMTREGGLTVALSGLGGDELFSGYPSFKVWNTLRKFKFAGNIPAGLRSKIMNMMPGKSIQKDKLRTILSGSIKPAELVYRMRQVFTDKLITELGKQPIDWIGTFAAEINRPQDQLTFTEMFLYCEPLLLKDTDQMSMASALEVRVPFLDHEFMNFVMKIPTHKRRYGYRKYSKGFFVDALKNDIPEECYNRPKSGFVLPMENWMKNDLKDFTLQGLHTPELQDLFGEQRLNTIYKRFTEGNRNVSWSRIWLLSVLGHWMHKNRVSVS